MTSSSCKSIFKKSSKYKVNDVSRKLSSEAESLQLLEAQCFSSICSFNDYFYKSRIDEIKHTHLKIDTKRLDALMVKVDSAIDNEISRHKNIVDLIKKKENHRLVLNIGSEMKGYLSKLFYIKTLISFGGYYRVRGQNTDFLTSFISGNNVDLSSVNLFTEFLNKKNYSKILTDELVKLFKRSYLFKSLYEFNRVIRIKNVGGRVDVNSKLERIVDYLTGGLPFNEGLLTIAENILLMYKASSENYFLDDSSVTSEFNKVINKKKYNSNKILSEIIDYVMSRSIVFGEKSELEILGNEIINVLANDVSTSYDQVISDFLDREQSAEYFKRDLSGRIKIAIEPMLIIGNSTLRRNVAEKYIKELIVITKSIVSFNNSVLQKNFDNFLDEIRIVLRSERAQIDDNIESYFTKLPAPDVNFNTHFEGTDKKRLHKLSLDLTHRYFAYSSFDIDSNDSSARMLSYFHNQIEASFVDFFEYADDISIGDYTDYASPYGSINVSWSTVRSLKYGIGIMAHELAHQVYNYLSEQRQSPLYFEGYFDKLDHWKKLSCVANWHRNKPDNHPSLDKNYLLEDWADYFSAKIMEVFKKKKSWTRNPYCLVDARLHGISSDLVLDRLNSITSYSQVLSNYLWYSDMDFVYFNRFLNTRPKHSNVLFRVLNFHTHSGETLSPSCRRLVEQHKLFQCNPE